MKATLEFDLPEDRESFDNCNNADRLYAALDEIREYLRGQSKYDGTDDIDKIYDKFYEIIGSNNIEL